MEKFEFLRTKLEVGNILSFDEIDLITKTLEIDKDKIINKTLNIDSMLKYADEQKQTARLNGDYNTFDSYDNTASKMLTTLQYVVFNK